MTNYAALDVSLEATAVCVVDEEGRILAEKKIPTCPDAIASWLAKTVPDLVRVGMETGPIGCVVVERVARQGPANRLHGRSARQRRVEGPAQQDRSQRCRGSRSNRAHWLVQAGHDQISLGI